MKLKFLLAPLVGAALFLASAAQATITIYVTQSSYLAAISAPGVDSFDNLTDNTPLSGPLTRLAGAYGYTASVGPSSPTFFRAGAPFPGDGWLTTNNNTDTITFSGFSASIRGVGGNFFGSNFANSLATTATINLSATDASGTVNQTLINPTTTSFVGFVSTGALSNVKVFVGVAGTGLGDVYPTVNNLTVGVAAAVPENQTLALMLSGLAMLGMAVRRSKR
jgi:hypothetical protein